MTALDGDAAHRLVSLNLAASGRAKVLTLELPASVVADALGYHDHTTSCLRNETSETWSRYMPKEITQGHQQAGYLRDPVADQSLMAQMLVGRCFSDSPSYLVAEHPRRSRVRVRMSVVVVARLAIEGEVHGPGSFTRVGSDLRFYIEAVRGDDLNFPDGCGNGTHNRVELALR